MVRSVSSRSFIAFFGVYGWKISGLTDTNRASQIVEGLGDGAWIGRTRRAARQVRVEGMLIAKGRDALDYGLSWLSSALDGDRCGQHSEACGVTDMEFFTDCPPERGQNTVYTEWFEVRKNYSTNPRFINHAGWALSSAVGTWGTNGEIAISDTAPSGSYLGYESTAIPASSGQVWTVSREISIPEGSPPVTLGMIAIEYGIGAAVLHYGESVTINPGENVRISATTAELKDGANYVRSVAFLNEPPGDIDRVIKMDKSLIEMSDVVGLYFDGDSEDEELVRYSWAGSVNASPSIREVRDAEFTPESDAEYALKVDPYIRYIHEVACTSGPLEKRVSTRDDWDMMDVEFTLTAGRPWIFEKMRTPELPVTPSTVVEDIAHNLVQYTSAEKSSDYTTAIAWNLSTNPSVEANADGWETIVDGGNIVESDVSGSRAVGELSVNGDASYKAVFTAGTSGSENSYFGIQQNVDITNRPANAPISFNMWAAEVLITGAATLTDIQIIAAWMDGDFTIESDLIGYVPVDGGATTVKSLIPPDGATSVTVQARAGLASWTGGTVISLYADALAVTVP